MTRSNKVNQAVAFCLPLFLISMVVCSFSGCGKSFPLSDVTGTVTMDGKPVNAGVRFTPASGDVKASTAQTKADGTYRLIFNPQNLGAIIGKNTVLVQYQGKLFTKEVEVEKSRKCTIDLELNEFEPQSP